jgi:hypothetical protein
MAARPTDILGPGSLPRGHPCSSKIADPAEKTCRSHPCRERPSAAFSMTEEFLRKRLPAIAEKMTTKTSFACRPSRRKPSVVRIRAVPGEQGLRRRRQRPRIHPCGMARRPRQRLVSNIPLLRSKAEHLVLAGPFGWQVGEAGNSHPMREPPVDGGLDEVGREEGKRDCHIHLADAAPLSLGDAVRGCRLVGDKFIEPPAPAGDRCDQGGAIFRT